MLFRIAVYRRSHSNRPLAKGYTATSFSDGNRAENEAIKDKFNEKLGVTKAQEQAMLAGSMIRWDSIAAKPKSYDENGKAIKPKDYER